MRTVLALVSLILSLLSVDLAAQSSRAAQWRMETGGQEVMRIAETSARGYAALPGSALVSVGAQVSHDGGDLVATLGATEIRFRPGSAEVAIGGETHTLSNPVYAENGVVYVPADFFRRFLVDAAGGALEVEPAARIVRRVRREEPAPYQAPRRTVSAALSSTPLAPLPPQPAAPAPTPPEAGAEEAVAAPAVPVTRETPKRRLVVVDAGHGGRDPGARGPGGTREKDVTLRIARRVAAMLRDDPTLEVRMTRDRDTLIALHDRARMANRWKDEGQPAVFLSIHANANESRSEKGFETYFLAEARTADARRVEQFENAAMQYEESPPPAGPLGFILTDLRQNQYLRESSGWAQIIQDRLREMHPGPDRGVKQAGFAVLRGTFMPAVLVEIGFISNRNEEQLLANADVQERIARKLADSVRDYFDGPAPRRATDDD
jgi:N-acetylmuramoyl-L-alanine amidase